MRSRVLNVLTVALVGCCALMIGGLAATYRAESFSASADEAMVDAGAGGTPVSPARRTAKFPSPAPPAPLPAGADRINPLTLRVATRVQPPQGEARVIEQTITRTANRIHVATSNGPEWLYVRNPVDPRRVNAYLIDHTERAVVFHSDSDLRALQAVDSWAHMLSLGVEVRALDALQSSGETRIIDGIRFARFRRADAAGPLDDIWWSGEHLLPAQFAASADGVTTTLSIVSIQRDVDEELLLAPDQRFPDFRVVHLADWMEHH